MMNCVKYRGETMNKYCPKCKMNFSDTFDECPYCEEKLIVQDMSLSETNELDILDMSDDEILYKFKDYLESIRNQGCNLTDKEFVDGIRQGQKEKLYNQHSSGVKSPKTHNVTTICPYCQSTDCKKISGLSKAGSVALWGIFALGKTTKQWHCNNCKSDF